jgi:hypothetical protein
MWADSAGQYRGRTTLYLSHEGPAEVQVRPPTGVELLHAQGAAGVHEPHRTDGRMITYQFPDARDTQVELLTLIWRSAEEPQRSWRRYMAVPEVVGLNPERTLVAVASARSRFCVAATEDGQTPAVFLLQRFEGLLACAADAGPESALPPAALIAELADAAKRLETIAGAVPGSDAAFDTSQQATYARLLERWDDIQETVGGEAQQPAAFISQADPGADGNPSAVGAVTQGAGSHVVLATLAPGEHVLTIWSIPRTAVQFVGAVLLLIGFAGLWAVGRRLAGRWSFSERFTPPKYAGLAAFGVIWWLLFAGSALGLVLILLAALAQVPALRQRSPVRPAC